MRQQCKTRFPLLKHTTDAIEMALARQEFGKVWHLITRIVLDDNGSGYESQVYEYEAECNGPVYAGWAPAKMHTMEEYPDLLVTRPCSTTELAAYLASNGFMHSDYLRQIEECDNIACLPATVLCWLSNCETGAGFAPGYGGISVPFTCTFCDYIGVPVKYTGKVRIAFDSMGFRNDLVKALAIFREIYWSAEDFPSALRVKFDTGALWAYEEFRKMNL